MGGKRAAAGIESFFRPRTIAVVGVSNDRSKLASIIYANLLGNFESGVLRASVFPVNPAHQRVEGKRCYPSLYILPEVPELVVVAVPAASSVEVVREAAGVGAKAAILVTGGFSEVGRGELEDEILEATVGRNLRILGPNTMGVLDTWSGVDSLFLPTTKRLKSGEELVSLVKPSRGEVAIIAQSGHLGEVIAEELSGEGIGVRALVGTGNQLDVSVEDLVEYFGHDDLTKVIAVYLEGVRDGPRFVQKVRGAAKRKPVIMLKLGKTDVGARAALTHTGSMVGDYEAYRAAFRRCGVVEATSLQELVDFSLAFSLASRPRGKRLLIVTNAGGVGGIAAEEAEKNGLRVQPLKKPTASRIREELGKNPYLANASLGNPIDLTATVPSRDFAKAAEIALGSGEYDLGLLLPTHQTPAIDLSVTVQVGDSLLRTLKPACVCVMGRSEVAQTLRHGFIGRGIPSFPTPERAVRALAALSSYTELSRLAKGAFPSKEMKVAASIKSVAGPLPTAQVDRILAKYGIPRPRSLQVASWREARRAARIGFPVACKLSSRGLLHKSEVGGVFLNVDNGRGLMEAFSKLKAIAHERSLPFEGMLVQKMAEKGIELIVGGSRDATFGPMVAFGAGGTCAGRGGDYAVWMAPVGKTGARDLVSATRTGMAILRGGDRNPRAIARLLETVSAFSRIVAENPSIAQIELNPLVFSKDGVTAVDARAVTGPRRLSK